MKALSATARLQFHKGFTLDDATALVPYFSKLGISHLYASPLLTARAGSTHGYDIVDHTTINPELGGEEALRRMVTALRAERMGLILDIVPNHMGVGYSDNAWWMDVLEWGRTSAYAEYFDIDWDPPDASLRGRMLAPFLGASYGECLGNGELVLRYDEADGRLCVYYHDHRFPIQPRDYAAILLTVGGPLEEPARLFGDLTPSGSIAGRDTVRAAAAAARQELAQPPYRTALNEAIAAYDPKTEAGRERLHRLLERQVFRLAWWRAAADEINWRRFFDVNGLAGVRQEVPEVFEATHAAVFRLFTEGLIDGVRIDHVDGLAYPREYCRKLRRRLESMMASRPVELQDQPPVIWIEKILAQHERLAADWLTDGTTGYDFMNDASAVLHDSASEAAFTELWAAVTHRPPVLEEEAIPARRQILRESLASELFVTATALHRIARRDLNTRDYTLTAIRHTLEELLVHFRTYRIYASAAGISAVDRRMLDWALAGARRTVRTADRPLLELVGQWLAGTGLRGVPAGSRRQEWQRAMVKFQQLSAPTAAKSVEDTAFYRYGRLLSRNEVGTEPSQWSLSVSAWHAHMKERAKRLPLALLATATHDHKRGEDTRARLAALSEIPGEWDTAVERWVRLNAPLRRDLSGPAPDRADELMLYQTLVGSWPLGLLPADRAGMEAYRERVAGWLEKALREGKRHSGWAVPNTEYESACLDFLAGTLDAERSVAAELAGFAARLAPAGAVNGLTQMVLRLTSPGVPDLYQGTEFWDLSLVDPDNRRPVDFAAREQALGQGGAPSALLPAWQDGRVKLAILHRILQVRARAPGLFTRGSYVPLRVEGAKAAHVLAFARVLDGKATIVAVPLLPIQLGVNESVPFIEQGIWAETAILLPRSLGERGCANILSEADGVNAKELPPMMRLPIRSLLADLPVAVSELR